MSYTFYLANLATFGIFLFLKKYFLASPKQKTEKKEKEVNEKAKREIEIKLIQKRSAENHLKEVESKGLIIIDAYYGDKEIVKKLIGIHNKNIFFSSNPQFSEMIIDVTVPLRFYIEGSKLILQQKKKKSLFGFYNPCKNNERIGLYIR